MKPLVVAFAVVLVAASACASTGDNSASDTTRAAESTSSSALQSCGTGGVVTPGQQTRTITTADGLEREFSIFMPSGYDSSTQTDVVFNFHGAGSNTIEQHIYGGFEPFAEDDGVILVTPQALAASPGNTVAWNARRAIPTQRREFPADDVDFVYELIDLLRSDYCVGALFAAGMSSGGAMSSALACQSDSPFAAIAPVTFSFFEPSCTDAESVPYVYFHGTDDDTVPFDGVEEVGIDPARTTAQEWADHNGCDSTPKEERISSEVVHFSWQDCDQPTNFYVIEGGGHTWPGSLEIERLGYVTDDISATEIIWDTFFG